MAVSRVDRPCCNGALMPTVASTRRYQPSTFTASAVMWGTVHFAAHVYRHHITALRCVQVPVTDADFAAVQKWKVPLLQKAAKRLCTDSHFQFMRVELFKFRRDNVWVEASPPSVSLFLKPQLA